MSMEHNEYLIKVHDLHRSFDQQQVLNGIDFKVKAGETVAVLGQSGTGKSVLLKLIVRLLEPDSGSIWIDKKDITTLPIHEVNEVRKRIGFLFQYAALYDSLTVGENVEFPLLWHSSLSPSERSDRVDELLARVGLKDAKAKMPSQISGGMKKRVGLARALVLDPQIILLDEPTAGLDPVTAAGINELFSGLQQERKISSIVVTHDMHAVKAVANHVVMLHEGQIVFDGTIDELQASHEPHVSEFVSQSL
jgi:phospholipid/cholesterol/gamma-HCH transport system ATP-binding protein